MKALGISDMCYTMSAKQWHCPRIKADWIHIIIIPSGAVTVVFRVNYVNSMAANGMARWIATSSVAYYYLSRINEPLSSTRTIFFIPMPSQYEENDSSKKFRRGMNCFQCGAVDLVDRLVVVKVNIRQRQIAPSWSFDQSTISWSLRAQWIPTEREIW